MSACVRTEGIGGIWIVRSCWVHGSRSYSNERGPRRRVYSPSCLPPSRARSNCMPRCLFSSLNCQPLTHFFYGKLRHQRLRPHRAQCLARHVPEATSSASARSTISPTRIPSRILLKWDSVHGKFDGEIGYDDENIIVRGHKIKILKERDPAQVAVERSWRWMSSWNRPAFSPAATRPSCTSAKAARKGPDQRAGEKSGRDDLHRRSTTRSTTRQSTPSFRTRAARPIASRRWRKCCTTISGSSMAS